MAPHKPKLLVLAPRYPYPIVSGDRVRLVNVCRQLSTRFDITLLCMCDDRSEFNADVPSDAPFVHVERVWLPRYRSCINSLWALAKTQPLQVAYYGSGRFERRVRMLAERHDLVMAHLIRTASYATSLGKPCVLEMTDAISRTYERARKTGDRKRLRTWVYSLEETRVRRFEQRMLDRFDLITVVSEHDRIHLAAGTETPNVAVASNGVDLATFPYYESFSTDPIVVFIGNLTTLPNLDAATYFAEDVLPALRRARPWIFRVVGRINPNDAARLARCEGVEITGQILRVSDAVAGARAGVCPMRIGSGIQNKVLEYMALGLPAITSSMSLQSLRAQPDREILVADDPAAYVAHLEKLFVNTDLARNVARAARGYVERNHNWEAELKPMVARMLALVAPTEAVVT